MTTRRYCRERGWQPEFRRKWIRAARIQETVGLEAEGTGRGFSDGMVRAA